VRTEIKKKTGVVIDEKGNIVSKKGDQDDDDNVESKLMNDRSNGSNQKQQKQYTPINNYKPTGNLIYGQDMFDKLEKKINLS
jgi:hypothetical protein